MLFSTGQPTEEGESKRRTKRAGQASITWDKSQGPVPVVTGQKVTAKVNAKGDVVYVCYSSAARFWRKAPDGNIEIAVNPDYQEGKSELGLLLLKPTGLQRGSTDVHWIPRLGVFLYEEEAGDPLLDSTTLPNDKTGIRLRNVPDLRIMPGRDGWRKARHSEEGYWDDEIEVPKSQQTAGSG